MKALAFFVQVQNEGSKAINQKIKYHSPEKTSLTKCPITEGSLL